MKRLWTSDDDAMLRQCYPGRATAALAKRLRRTPNAVRQRAIGLGLRKTEAALRKARGFQKGNRPWHKGMRGIFFRGRSLPHWFKKGHRIGMAAKRVKPLGSVYKCPRNGVWFRKVADIPGDRHNSWKRIHVLMWEEHFGPVPPGHVVAFRDGNRDRIVIDNLECMTRAESMRRHTVHLKAAQERAEIRERAGQNRAHNKQARAVRRIQLMGAIA